MYTRGIIERYGAAIEDDQARTEFLERTQGIEFARTKIGEICSGSAVRNALKGSSVEHLADDLGRNYVNFLAEEDPNGVG